MPTFPSGQQNRGPNLAGIMGWINALDEGLRGDGLGKDGTALTALINALPSTGGVIVLPPGTYNFDSQPTVPTNVTLVISAGVTITGSQPTASGTGVIIDYRNAFTVTGLLATTIYVQSGVLSASSVSQPLWTAPNDASTWQLASVSARFTTASTSGTLTVETAGGGVAVGAGTGQLAGTISLSGTANQNVFGTVAPSVTLTQTFSLNLVFAGVLTNLAGLVVTVGLKRLS